MGWAEMTKTGLNDASGVVWALGGFFFFFIFLHFLKNTNLFFMVYTVVIHELRDRGRRRRERAQTTPDASFKP